MVAIVSQGNELDTVNATRPVPPGQSHIGGNLGTMSGRRVACLSPAATADKSDPTVEIGDTSG